MVVKLKDAQTRWDEIDTWTVTDNVSKEIQVERIYPSGEPSSWVAGGTYSVTYRAVDDSQN